MKTWLFSSYSLVILALLGRVPESFIKSEKRVYVTFLGKCRKSLRFTIFNNSGTRPRNIARSNRETWKVGDWKQKRQIDVLMEADGRRTTFF